MCVCCNLQHFQKLGGELRFRSEELEKLCGGGVNGGQLPLLSLGLQPTPSMATSGPEEKNDEGKCVLVSVHVCACVRLCVCVCVCVCVCLSAHVSVHVRLCLPVALSLSRPLFSTSCTVQAA